MYIDINSLSSFLLFSLSLARAELTRETHYVIIKIVIKLKT